MMQHVISIPHYLCQENRNFKCLQENAWKMFSVMTIESAFRSLLEGGCPETRRILKQLKGHRAV
jgi:hypothetical protein